MAELIITEANVTSQLTGTTYRSYETLEAITAGQLVYQASDSTIGLADAASAVDPVKQFVLGVALSSSTGANEYIVVAKNGEYVVGAAVVAGQMYCLGPTAGGISLFSDLDVGQSDVVSYLGYALDTTSLRIQTNNTGVAKA